MRASDLKFGLIFFVVSLIAKLPYLGTFLTIDEPRWIHGAGQFLLALHSGNLEQTYWHFFPGITTTWGGAIILWLQSLTANFDTLDKFVAFNMEHLAGNVGAMRLSSVILTSITLPFVYALARPLLGRWAAILGVGLLAVDPFWLAHSRIVNGDALSGGLMVAAYLAFALLLFKPDLKLAVISGVFVGLSLLTKLPAPILAPCIILLTIIGYLKVRNWRFWLKALLLCGLVSAAVFIILWPAMWVAPVKTLTMMYQDTFDVGDIGGKDKVEFFLGQVRDTQSPFFYPVALLFRTTPINLIGLILSLGVLFIPKNSKSRETALLLWLFILIIVLFSNISPKKADRYAMSVMVTVNLLAGVGWIWLLGRISEWANGRIYEYANGRILANSNKFAIHNLQSCAERSRSITIHHLLIIALIAIQLIFTLISYPYLLTYYNPLLGGYAKAAELVPVGWGEGLEQAAAWINNQPDGRQATTSPYYENVTNHYLAGTSLDWPKDGKKQVLADYVVFYIAQTQRKLPYPGLVDYFQKQTPVYVVRSGETPYVWVYKRQYPINALEGEAQIVGRAQIVGYSRLASKLSPARSTGVILYFLTHDQPLPDNEDFRVSLLDSAGNEHSLWHSADTNEWTPNAIIEWKGELVLPADLAPGNYKLKVSLVDTNINSEVASFPFDDEVITVEP